MSKYCDDWEEMSPYLPGKIRAESALDMFSECIQADKRYKNDFDGFGLLAERCSPFFIDCARMLKKNEKQLFAHRVATMFHGNFRSMMYESMLT